MALVIQIDVANLLVNIGIGGAKYTSNYDIMWFVQNKTSSDNKIRQIVRQEQHHCYNDVPTNIDSGMLMAFVLEKYKISDLGCFVKYATMFEHSADKIILIRINNDGAKVKDGEDAEEIYAILCDVDIYCKDEKKTKYIGQCNDYGGGGVTKGAAEGLSAISKQDKAVYYVAECMLHAASKLLKNDTEKTFVESGLGEETLQKFIHT